MGAPVAPSPTVQGVEPAPSATPAKKKDKPPPEPKASLRELFQYLSFGDWLMMCLAMAGGTAHGIAQPVRRSPVRSPRRKFSNRACASARLQFMLLPFFDMFEALSSSSVLEGAVVDESFM